MKARNYEDHRGDGEPLGYRASSCVRAETMAFGTLGLAGAASVIIALVSASLPAEVRKDPVTDMVNYVRNGQVMADVRTVTEIVRYLFESEPPTATNLLEQHSATNRTVPTNIPLATPIAYPIAG